MNAEIMIPLKRYLILQIRIINFFVFHLFFIFLYFHFNQDFQTFQCLFVCFSPSFTVFAGCTTNCLHLTSCRICFKMDRFSSNKFNFDLFLIFIVFAYKLDPFQRVANLFIFLKMFCNCVSKL